MRLETFTVTVYTLYVHEQGMHKNCFTQVLYRGLKAVLWGSEVRQQRVDVGNSHLCLVFIWALGKVLPVGNLQPVGSTFSCMSDDSCNCTIVPS